MKKIIVVVDDKEIIFEGDIHIATSANAGVQTSLVIRDGDVNVAEFAKWTYWREVKT